MTRLVKAAASGDLVRRFVPSLAKGPPRAGGPDETAGEHTPLAAALAEVERLGSALAEAKAQAARAEKAAREAGRAEGLGEAAAAEDRRLAALDKALVSAAERLEEKLAATERLAGSLAATALAKLVAPDVAMSALVARSVERQMRLVRAEAVVAIHVSDNDFPDDAALQALAAQAGTGSARLTADPALGPGECRIDLTLGHIDLGVAGRWREAATLLGDLAAEGERP